jgi:phosphopantothenoylcysteine decarboxylase/phosphopantothenate--cysteine ligase
MLQGKKILVAITGSIAAYKSILLVRLLVKAGAEVKVVMTPAAKDFVSPLVLATLSKQEVVVDLSEGNQWSNHVMLGRWADVMVIAPASCNTLAKLANGICDNLLLAVYLSATCPVAIAPAMDEDMWHHPATQKNINKLIGYGHQVIKVENGELASGLYGEGRMAEPETIIQQLIEQYFRSNELKGKYALVSAGPTYEALDPVRFIGNHSSGKMGFALANSLYEKGAHVILITGPTNQQAAYKGIETIQVTSAQQMFDACTKYFKKASIAIMSAAVADYTPKQVAKQKIKKKDAGITIELTKTKDILATLGQQKKKNQLLVGFALETNNELEHALGKLKSKNADCIVLNSLNDKQAGFGFDTNKVSMLFKDGSIKELPLASKRVVATEIVSHIIPFISS